MRFLPVIVSMSFICGFAGPRSVAADWPCWRGPHGDGISDETQVPLHWNGATGENIVWKVDVPGVGHSSPIISRDRIFVATCLEETQDRLLLCFDRHDGKLLWQQSVVKSPLESKHELNTRASGTPATDGQTVFTAFLVADEPTAESGGDKKPGKGPVKGKMLVSAFDRDGKALWSVRPGPFSSVHGFCSSPVLYENLVIVNGDHDGDSFITALNKSTGETVWKVARRHKTRSYCTPIIRTVNGRTEMVMSGSKHIIAYDPLTGKELWNIEGPTEQFVASMVFDGDRYFMCAGFPTHHVMAITPAGNGDVTTSHVQWHSEAAKCYVPSPVVVDGLLFVADDRGTASAFDAKTGERIWTDRLGNHFSASLIVAGGNTYFTADDGTTKVVQPGRPPKVIAENPLGEFCYASPAVSNGQIFIRGEKHLFAIGQAD